MSASEFDILVIGAGIAGVSVAAHLSAGRRVAVLERESQPAYHSTGRSAALFSAIYGPPQVRALSRASHDFFFNTPSGFAEAPLVRTRGALYIASDAQRAKFEAFQELPDVAPATRRLSTAEALEICPILRPDHVAVAALEPDAADVDVHGLQEGYLRLLRSNGGLVLTDHPVTRLERQGDIWRVHVAGGETLTAPVIVNAAGAWADVLGEMAGAEAIGLQPRRRTALLVDPPEGVPSDAWPMVIDIDESFYFKPDAGLLLLSPADETPMEPCDVQPDEWDVAVAVDRVSTATTLDVRRIKHKWAGLRSFVDDRTPVVGYDPRVAGFFWLAGQGGYGIQTSPGLSRAAAALVLGEPVPSDLRDHGVNAHELSPARLKAILAVAAH